MVGGKLRSRFIVQVRMRAIPPRNPANHHRHFNVHPTIPVEIWASRRKVEYGTRPAVNDGSEHPSPYRGV